MTIPGKGNVIFYKVTILNTQQVNEMERCEQQQVEFYSPSLLSERHNKNHGSMISTDVREHGILFSQSQMKWESYNKRAIRTGLVFVSTRRKKIGEKANSDKNIAASLQHLHGGVKSVLQGGWCKGESRDVEGWWGFPKLKTKVKC